MSFLLQGAEKLWIMDLGFSLIDDPHIEKNILLATLVTLICLEPHLVLQREDRMEMMHMPKDLKDLLLVTVRGVAVIMTLFLAQKGHILLWLVPQFLQVIMSSLAYDLTIS